MLAYLCWCVALVCVGTGELEEMETAITKCDTKVGYLTDLMGEIDEDHRGAATYALTKANEMSRRIGLLEVSEGAPSYLSNMQSRSLAHDTVILDSFGDPVASMAELWRVVTELKASNMALTTRVSALTAEVSSQGGVVLGNMTFTSEAQIMQLVMLECPSGDAFEIFTDVVSLPCFDSGYEPATGWEKTTKFMAADGQYSTTAGGGVLQPSARFLLHQWEASHRWDKDSCFQDRRDLAWRRWFGGPSSRD